MNRSQVYTVSRFKLRGRGREGRGAMMIMLAHATQKTVDNNFLKVLWELQQLK